MKEYVVIENDYFEIFIPKKIENFGYEVMNFSTERVIEYLKFFKKNKLDNKIKVAYLFNYNDFISRIKDLCGNIDNLPPIWAKGAYFADEIQIIVEEDNLYERFNTLAHECFHLLFQKFVYDKNNFDRITWLDEALACNFDLTTEKLIKNGEFLNIVLLLNRDKKIFPNMNDVSLENNNIVTDKYDCYLAFRVIGRYLIETMSFDELLLYVNDLERVMNDSRHILDDGLKYFNIKYGYLTNNEKIKKARMFCNEVRILAEKYNLPFFVVTDGASATSNNGCEAVKYSREAHIKWEKSNNYNPNHDWSDNIEK